MLLSGILEKKLSEHIRLTYFNVIEYEDFAKRLDECLVSIWFGPKEQRSLEVTKRKVRNYYESRGSFFALWLLRRVLPSYLLGASWISAGLSCVKPRRGIDKKGI